MLLFFGLLLLLRSLPATEGCSANQQSTATLTAGEDSRFLQDAAIFMLPSNSTCQWNITAPEGKVVKIDLWYFSFYEPCDEEYLKISDGPVAESSKILAKYCVNSTGILFQTFFSSGRSLWIETKKGISNSTLTRIQVRYEAIDFEECSINSTLHTPQSPVEHNFSSPYYPQGYRMNTTCGWYITAAENQTVVLQLIKYLLDYWVDDKVEVYDVEPSSELSLINTFTGNIVWRKPVTIYSKYHRLYVVFKSDGKKKSEEKGMFASYTAITPGQSCSSGNSLAENQNIVLKNPSGIIKTPGYPFNYPDNLIDQCYWKILAPKGSVVRVEFSSFRLRRGDCVNIINAMNRRFPIRSTLYCGKHPSFIVYSMTNELGINAQERLHLSNTGPGFTANYTTVPADSSGTCRPSENSTVHMTGEGRSFASPGFPLHPGQGACHWNISVPAGNFIKLSFPWVLGPSNESYVEVYDVTNSTRVLLGTFSLLNNVKVVYSRGNNLLVTFVIASPAQSRSGFLATYQTVKSVPATYACSTANGRRIELHGSRGELASYQYPMSYSNDADCSWEIEVPVGFIVNLTFHSFDLEQSQDCRADYVLIKQGKYAFEADEIGRFCGSSLPGMILSNHTKVYVDFVADSSERYPGFHASYTAVPNPAMGPCKTQGIDNIIPMTGESGRLFSPLYPQTFPHNMKCTWLITVPQGHFVRLRITSFFLAHICKPGTNLEIRNGQSSSSDLLKTFCGRNFETFEVFSSGRHIWVRFQSSADEFQYGTGFNALFEMVNQLPASFACTTQNHRVKLESKTGTLASYNYPLPYDDNIECVWNIYVDTDYKIELSFDFFNLSQSSDCSEDYVEVRDGLFDTSDVIGKYCGSEKPSKITSDAWDLRVAFKSSGKTKYPGFKATYETKNDVSSLFVLKIVGIVIGSLSFLFLCVSACVVCCKKRHNQAQPGLPSTYAQPAAYGQVPTTYGQPPTTYGQPDTYGMPATNQDIDNPSQGADGDKRKQTTSF